jgi:outer membrane protein assembly factor BamA
MRSIRGMVIIALCIGAVPPYAHAQERTRAAEAGVACPGEAADAQPSRGSLVKRFLSRLRGSGLLGPVEGFGVRVGGIESGSGFAVGPSWRKSTLFGGNLEVSASGARAIGGDTGVDGSVLVPHAGTHRLALGLDASMTRLTDERFFGRGLDAARADEAAFALASYRVTAHATYEAAPWLRLSANGGLQTMRATGRRARNVPSADGRFAAGHVPGLGVEARFTTVGLGATIDYRDVPGNPRDGGRYHVALSRSIGGPAPRHSFTRFHTELEQHVSMAKRQGVLTLRALATATVADRGHDVPFYLQPRLGGSRVLRGFSSDRFRDRSAVAVQAEYGWDVLPFVNAVAFVEAGAVAARWQDLDAQRFRKSYGVGVRFGSGRRVALRTDVAFGGEGTRLTMRFNHAF